MNVVPTHVLIFEDNPSDALLLRVALERDPLDQFSLTIVERLGEGLSLLARASFDVIVLDLGLPDSQGLETFERVHQVTPHLPIIVFSGNTDEKDAIQAVRAGAQDYLVKSVGSFEMAGRAIRHAIERHRLQKSLQETNAKLAHAQSLAHIGSWENYIPIGEITWSDEMYRIMGFPLHTSIQLAEAASVFPPDELKRFQEAVHASLHEGVPYSMDYRIVRSDGMERYIHDEGDVVRDENGTPIWMRGTTQDITERKLFEETLLKNQQLLHEAQGIANLGSWTSYIQAGMYDASPECARLLGWKAGLHPLQDLFEAIYPEDREEMERVWRFALHHGDFDLEHRILVHGQVRWVHVKAQIRFDPDGKPLFALGITQDITARKQAEAALAQRLTELELLYQSGLALSGELEPKQVAGKLINILEKKMDWHHVAIRSYAPESDRLELLTFNQPNLENDLQRQAVEARFNQFVPDTRHGFSGWAVRHGQVVRVGDVRNDERYAETFPGICSGLYVPMMLGERVTGVVSVESEKMNAFSDSDERLLKTIANQAAVSFENARLFLSLQGELAERKKAEEALRASEERYRLITQYVDDIVWQLDPQLQFVFASPAVERVLGYTVEEALTMKVTEVLDAEGLAQMRMVIQARLSGETHAHRPSEYKMKHQDGHWVDVEVVSAPVFDNQQHLLGFVGVTRQVTERKMAELALRASEAQYRTLALELDDRVQQRTAEVQDLYENAPTGYHSLDREGKFLRINQTELNWLGYSREEMLGHSFAEFITPESLSTFQKSFPIFLARGWVRDLEFDMIRKDGTTFPILVSATSIRDEQGDHLISRSTVFDNTERKQAELALHQSRDELRAANAALEQASRLKDEFLANMSHELRTPLNSILAFSEGLIEQYRGPLNEHQLTSVRNIEASGRHLLALINDILDLSKVEAGRLNLQVQLVSLADVCESSLMFVKAAASKKDLRLGFHLNDHLAIMEADPKRLKQMLVNLLSNAVKFTPTNGQVTLDVATDPEAGQVTFSVKDTGIGIAPEDLNRLFNPFTQLDSRLSRQHEGTGLGLALVRRLAELHGGGVRVHSEMGQGSEFILVLPYHPPVKKSSASPVAAGPETTPAAPLPPTVHAETARILLAEDNDFSIQAISDYLDAKGYQIITAHNGREALEQARALAPHLILMDIQMPEMDGLEAIQRLRALPAFATTPIIALTALAMPGDRERCLQAGANEYMSKPVRLKELAANIQTLLAQDRNEIPRA